MNIQSLAYALRFFPDDENIVVSDIITGSTLLRGKKRDITNTASYRQLSGNALVKIRAKRALLVCYISRESAE